MIQLISPTIAHVELIESYRNSFREDQETLHGGSYLEQTESIPEWLALQAAYASEDTVPAGRVPGAVFLAMQGNEMIGILNLRYRLTEYLENFGGHIGYSVKKTARNHGYASQMLAAALLIAKAAGMNRVLLTCDADNMASAKVIEKNGGVLEDIRENEDGQTKRYWINLG